MNRRADVKLASSTENVEILARLAQDERRLPGSEARDALGSERKSLFAIVSGLMAVAVLSSLATWYFLQPGGQAKPELTPLETSTTPAPSVQTPRVPSPGAVLEATGFVVARNKASVSSDITGRIHSIEVVLGQRVKKGDVIAVLDDREARLRLSAAELRVRQGRLAEKSAQVTARLEEDRFRQMERLVGGQYVSDAMYDQTRAAYENSLIQSKSASVSLSDGENSLQAARIFVERHVIRAPFDGIIVDVSARPGETVSPTSGGNSFIRTGIVQLVDPDSLYVVAEVPERQVVPIREGQPVEIVGKSLGREVHATRVEWIAPISNRQRGIVEVGMDLENPKVRFIDGMEVDVRFMKQQVGPSGANVENTKDGR